MLLHMKNDEIRIKVNLLLLSLEGWDNILST